MYVIQRPVYEPDRCYCDTDYVLTYPGLEVTSLSKEEIEERQLMTDRLYIDSRFNAILGVIFMALYGNYNERTNKTKSVCEGFLQGSFRLIWCLLSFIMITDVEAKPSPTSKVVRSKVLIRDGHAAEDLEWWSQYATDLFQLIQESQEFEKRLVNSEKRHVMNTSSSKMFGKKYPKTNFEMIGIMKEYEKMILPAYELTKRLQDKFDEMKQFYVQSCESE